MEFKKGVPYYIVVVENREKDGSYRVFGDCLYDDAFIAGHFYDTRKEAEILADSHRQVTDYKLDVKVVEVWL